MEKNSHGATEEIDFNVDFLLYAAYSICQISLLTRHVKNAVYVNYKRMQNKFLAGCQRKRRFTMSKVLFSQAGPQKKF